MKSRRDMSRDATIKRLVAIYRGVNVFFEWLALGLLVAMTLVTTYRVLMRFFFGFTPSWTEELSCILVIWVTVIGLAIGVRERLHLGITLFYEHFPPAVRSVLDGVILALQGVLGVYLSVEGLRLTIDQYHSTMCVVKILPFSNRLMPNSILYVCVPFAGILILVYTAIQIFDKNHRFELRTLHTEGVA